MYHRKPEHYRNYSISKVGNNQVFGLAESVLGFNWHFNLSCKSMDGGIMLAIPTWDFLEILESYEHLGEEMIGYAKEIESNMTTQIKYNHFNHIHISLCNSHHIPRKVSPSPQLTG